MRMLARLMLLVAIALGALWLLERYGTPSELTHDARAEVDSAVRRAKELVPDLEVGAMLEELKRTGRVVRRKTDGAATRLGEATADARTTATIKAKLVVDSKLSALDISVDTTDGLVTLAGRVESPEAMARAIRLALDEGNVREVVSTLQVAERDSAAQ